MAEIIPAILPQNYEDLKNKISLVRGLVPFVQIDICDGHFVKTVGWPFHDGDQQSLDNILNEREGMPFWEDIDFELDLMVAHAVEDFDTYMKLGPKRIIFHIEAMPDIQAFSDFLEGIDMYIREHLQIGIAINITTNVEIIFPLVSKIDFVQCMGIEYIGVQGQPFSTHVLSQISKIHKAFPELTISVDGGVSLANAPALLEAGVERLVSGSVIFGSKDIYETIQYFKYL